MPITPADLAHLKQRHLAFLAARLTSPEAEAEWRASLAAGFADLLSMRLRDLADAPALAGALDTILTAGAVAQAARPAAERLLPIVLREIAAEPGKLGDRVPAGARKKIEDLLARPNALSDRLLRELSEQQAVQDVMRDVLHDGLKEFSEKVNPFIAEWGIPSLLKKMSVFGGAMTKGLESVRAELDRRTEPELQRFLAGFTKKGLRRMVDAAVSRSTDPASIALRKHMLAWILDQEIASLAADLDPTSIAMAQDITLDILAAEVGTEARKAQRRRLIDEALAAAGDRTVGEILLALGVTFIPDFDALARASWPAVKAIVSAPSVQAWLGKIVGEFYDAEIAAG